MKKAALLIVVLLLGTASWAQTVPDGLEWEIVAGKSVTIPSSVTVIDDESFLGCSSLESATLSRRTRVGQGTFPESARIVYRD
jgi:hypothetical protein